MTRYLISSGAHAMDHIPGEDMPAVAKAAHAVVQEALNAGVYLFAGGLEFQRPGIGGTYPRRTRVPRGFLLAGRGRAVAEIRDASGPAANHRRRTHDVRERPVAWGFTRSRAVS